MAYSDVPAPLKGLGITFITVASIGVFLGIILLLVVILLVAKQYLTPSGKVKITINGEKELEVEQ
eukprot:8720963-Prorocentrum_lima.AAC.1